MHVRSVRWSDFPALREIYYELYSERDAGQFIGITLFRDRPSLADEVDWFVRGYRRVLAGDDIWSVAEDAGEAVGACTIQRVGPTAGSEQAHLGVLGILVRRDRRGRGVGSALLTHALAVARERFEVVRLSVFTANEAARRLYERFGFVTMGRMPRHVKRDSAYHDEYEMALVFDGPPPANP